MAAVDLSVALIAVAVLLAVSALAGVLLRRSRGRRLAAKTSDAVDTAAIGAGPRGERATLLQFSTEMCARCPGVRRTLVEIADARAGVRHLDVDLTHRPDLARRFGVLQTPTVLVLDHRGVERSRFGGAPTRAALETELSRLSEEARHG